MCLGITWYLYNDMQFHWIAPLALIPFVLGRKAISFIMATIFVLIGIISTLSILLYYPNMLLSGPAFLADQVSCVYTFMFGKILCFLYSLVLTSSKISMLLLGVVYLRTQSVLSLASLLSSLVENIVSTDILKSLELYWPFFLAWLVYLQLIQIIFLLQVLTDQYLLHIKHFQEHSGLLLLDGYSFYVVLIKVDW